MATVTTIDWSQYTAEEIAATGEGRGTMSQSFEDEKAEYAAACEYAARMRNPVRQRFAEAWIRYRWDGAPEPIAPDAISNAQLRRMVGLLGGRVKGEGR
jgi:hypothetical protein